MPEKSKMTQEENFLTRRYLIWCYKTTKEELDRIDRYFTQLHVDEKVLSSILKSRAPADKEVADQCLRKISGFKKYIKNKKNKVVARKFVDKRKKTLQPDYWYLKTRLNAIEKVIKELFGAKELKVIQGLYEETMTRRILEAREH
ncbi:MAG: hypothetical protein KAJ18_01595 [Candidatus Omnitrophica bacterium]|nr:hypothetical protein [Candidatus Omnitrophota bacterium]